MPSVHLPANDNDNDDVLGVQTGGHADGDTYGHAVCMRLALSTFDFMIFEELLSAPFWQYVTHIVLTDWLVMSEDGVLALGQGRTGFRFSAFTMLQPLKEFLERWSHLKVIWSMPDITADSIMQSRVRVYGVMVVQSLETLVRNFCLKMDGLLLDTAWVPSLSDTYRGLDALKEVLHNLEVEKIWVIHLSGVALYDWHHRLFMETFAPMIEYWILKAFGYLHFEPTVYTEHGTFFNLSAVSESACEDVEHAIFTLTNQWMLPENKVLLYISTTGAEYRVTDTNKCFGFSTIPLHEVRRLMCCLDGSSYQKEVNVERGTSLMRMDDKVISYDNEMMRDRKLEMAKKLGGIMMGGLENDLFPFHRQSLVSSALRVFNV